MPAGYDQLLYVLPFDHRHSYGHEVFGFNDPMTPEQIAVVAASKGVIYDGFKRALKAGVPKERAAILVDEEFGAEILRDAHQQGYHFAQPVEKSGEHEFHFEFGDGLHQARREVRSDIRQSARALQPGRRRCHERPPERPAQAGFGLLPQARSVLHVRVARAPRAEAGSTNSAAIIAFTIEKCVPG